MTIPAALEHLLEPFDPEGTRVTDLLVEAGSPPMYRTDGELHPAPGAAMLSPRDVEHLVRALVGQPAFERFEERRELDLSFGWRDKARFRVNAYWQRGSIGIALRLLPYRIPTFEEIGAPPVTERLVGLPHGLILVTGPTGCGKSTTLAAMIEWINQHRPAHILTIEDPIEYMHRNKMSMVSQREVGDDTLTFADGLRAALREDPDVLLIGEMRDLETIATALTMAETGHLVFATLHTNDAPQAIDRVVDVFPSDRQMQVRVQLAAALGAVIYQQLVPRIGGGRVAAYEVLVATAPVRNLIKESKTSMLRNVMLTSARDGMCTLEASLTRLIERGVISREEAMARSMYEAEITAVSPRLTRAR